MPVSSHPTQVALLLSVIFACKSGIQDESTAMGASGPSDLNLWSVTLDIECDKATAGTPRGEACRIARDFAKGTPPSEWPESGRQVWFGRIYRAVVGKAETTDFYFLQVQPGHPPALELAFDELGSVLRVEGSARELYAESPDEKAEAEALLDAVQSHGPVVPSGALSFVQTTEPKHGFLAMAGTKGASVIMVAKQRHYMRLQNNRLLMIDPHQNGGGWFSELWKLPPG